jgi:hypothetical protein
MQTRTSNNWKCKAGGFDAMKTRFIDFEADYPEINCQTINFSEVVNCNNRKHFHKDCLISTYLDDYHLERYWNKPDYYLKYWKDVSAVMTPNYSMLIGMPDPMLRWQTYRSRFVGYIWQKAGINVVPTVCWSDEKCFDYCFKGIAKNSIVSVSSIGMIADWQLSYFMNGWKVMLAELEPSKILFMASKKYRHLFTDERIQWLDSFFENQRKKIWAEVQGKN